MRRFVTLLFLGIVGVASAGEVHYGEMELAFGKVRQADGTYKDVKGIKFPYKMERIEARRITAMEALKRKYSFPGFTAQRVGTPAIERWGKFEGGGDSFGPEALTEVYKNESGPTYAILDPSEWLDPSSLDDLTISAAGVGKVWEQLTIGYDWDGSNSQRIIIRWRIWDNNIDNPDGQNDFSGVIGDFGGYFYPSQAGTWKVTFGGVAQAGVAATDTSIYMATQFRTDNPNGNGPFRPDFRCVYNNMSAPAIGSSMDQWWFDNDNGADGIYENSEIDQLSEGLSNMLYTITAQGDSQVFTGLPISVNIIKGVLQSGNFISLWFGFDTDEFIVREPNNDSGSPRCIVEVTGRANSPTISSISIDALVRASRPSGTFCQIQLYRYRGTPGWVTLGTTVSLTNTPQPIAFTYGGTIPVSDFVDPTTRDMKVRLNFLRPLFNTFPAPVAPSYTIDKMNWRYSSP